MAVTNAAIQLAIAVLQGDEAAAHALADLYCEESAGLIREIPPIRELRVDKGRLRAVFYAHPNVAVNWREVQHAYEQWRDHGEVLILANARMDLYLLPKEMAPND